MMALVIGKGGWGCGPSATTVPIPIDLTTYRYWKG
jgi:hypothetical protein